MLKFNAKPVFYLILLTSFTSSSYGMGSIGQKAVSRLTHIKPYRISSIKKFSTSPEENFKAILKEEYDKGFKAGEEAAYKECNKGLDQIADAAKKGIKHIAVVGGLSLGLGYIVHQSNIIHCPK